MNKHSLALAFLGLAVGCGGGEGDLSIAADVDSVISAGLAAGTGPEEIADGWSLAYSTYAVHFDDVVLERRAAGEARTLALGRVVDLAAVPGQVTLGALEGLASGRWDALSYGVRSAGPESDCDVSAGDVGDPESLCRAMIDGGLGVIVEGAIENPEGRSCPPDGTPDGEDSCVAAPRVAFRFELPLDARFVECQTESGLGVGIPSGGRAAVTLSYHSEHLLYDAFGEGARTITLRAQFIANADLDADGVVTTDELESIPVAQFDELFTNGTAIESFSATYSLSGALVPIETAADYVRAHLMTQGHLDGEQECEPEVL